MKYVIYGINRVAKDFLYIFDHLDVLCLADDKQVIKRLPSEFAGYKIKELEEVLADSSYDKIILCGFTKIDKWYKEKKLQAGGLVRGKDYLYEEDFFESLDEFGIPSQRKLAVWGTGQTAGAFAEWNQHNRKYEIQVYFDNQKTKETFYNVPVMTPDQVSDWKEYYIIVAVARDGDIREQLQSMGLERGIDFVSFQTVTGQPSHMLRQTIFDRSYYDLDCRTMLGHLEIMQGGHTRCCCTTFVKQDLDNIFDMDVDMLWNSSLHKIMCLSTENRTFSFCDKSMCPLFVAKRNGEGMELAGDEMDRPYRRMASSPEVLSLGYDSSCNLSCSTCRKKVHFAEGLELEKVKQVTEKVVKEYLPRCRFLILAGDGEVFASPAYREIYEAQGCNPDYIRLLSNGTLFTPRNWERFIVGKTGKIMLTVSVDAATKQTYEHIRRNGNFDVLKENMAFASDLRKRSEISYFRMNFVVQQANYQEMVPFVQWGEQLGVDEIFFTKILNWGTYTPEEFAEISMMESDGITPKPELKEVLAHPVMKSRIVDLGTIQYSHKIDEIGVVENYYMWELEKRGGTIFI